MAVPRANTKIVVVGGGGTMGSSTALHLIRSGYSTASITISDVCPIPSSQAAGHDLNKIMSIRIRNKPDLQLSLDALDMLKMICCSGPTLTMLACALEKTNVLLDNEDEILAKMPAFTREQVKGWKGVHGQDGGWLAAAEAINAPVTSFGTRASSSDFSGLYAPNPDVHGASHGNIEPSAGAFARPLSSGNGKTCTGVRTLDGTNYYADKVVLATGAWSPALVDLEGQCVSKAWVFAHIQLTPEEAAEFKNTPVIYDGEYGFFFEPTEDNIKVCDEFPGFTRFMLHKPFGSDVAEQISVPRSHSQHPTDTYPDASEATIRKAVARFLPRFKDRQLLNRAMCWCTDTADANLLICEHPRWKNFILATGDSGHSLKFLPNLGKHVVELIEGTLSHDLAYAWRWRPGGDALKSGRAAHAKDLADMPGWKHDRTSQL